MGSGFALAVRERPAGSLTPAQAELRRRVLAAVHSPRTRRSYGEALDDLFRFLAGRPLTRSLLQEWKAGMEGLSASTVNVRLSAVRKLVAEAQAEGAIGSEEAARLTGVPNIRQRGARLRDWLTREQAREPLAVPDRSTLKASATTRSWPCWSAARCAGSSSRPWTSLPYSSERADGCWPTW